MISKNLYKSAHKLSKVLPIMIIGCLIIVMCGCGKEQAKKPTNAGVATNSIHEITAKEDLKSNQTNKQISAKTIVGLASNLDDSVKTFSLSLDSAQKLCSGDSIAPDVATNMTPELAEAMRQHAYDLLFNGKLSECENLVTQVLQCGSLSIKKVNSLNSILASALLKQEKYSQAKPLFEKIIEFRNQLSESDAAIDGHALKAASGLAKVCFAETNKVQVIKVANEGIKIAKDSKVPQKVIEGYIQLYANILKRAGDINAAIDVLSNTEWTTQRTQQRAEYLIEKMRSKQINPK